MMDAHLSKIIINLIKSIKIFANIVSIWYEVKYRMTMEVEIASCRKSNEIMTKFYLFGTLIQTK